MCCAVGIFVICVFCRLVVLVRLSVPVHVIDWKDGSVKPYSLTHYIITGVFIFLFYATTIRLSFDCLSKVIKVTV